MTFSTVGQGWEALPKGKPMTGTHLHRCPECGDLSLDPRTGKCDGVHVDESWTYRLPAEYQDLAA